MRFIPTYVGHTGQIAQRVHRRGRFIPTYVGHTPCVPTDCGILPVHPHLRGAYCRSKHSYGRKGGSSPPTWGIRGGPSWWRSAARFIPTYVGHTPGQNITGRMITVHPHLRGAYKLSRTSTSSPHGSSPHTWGIRMHPCRQPSPLTVHPHIRGAYHSLIKFQPLSCGSSPHTWGIHKHHGFQSNRLRFIPTYVGHTSTKRQLSQLVFGSSPHTWGIPVSYQPQAQAFRFIPTYVGHTSSRSAGCSRRPVHPHIRGAYRRGRCPETNSYGSSPHTWGIHLAFQSGPQARRFIPTYVGHTPGAFRGRISPSVHPHIRGAYTGPP